GQWYMTETELTHTSQLPEDVQKALANSEYAQWYIDDIDRLERNGTETIYVIEVKKDKQEYDLYYSADGILVKVQADLTDDDYENYLPDASELPASLRQFIQNKYPNSRIIETETEHNRTEVDIIHENRSKEVIFDASGNWLNTHYDVRQNEVETAVMNALKTSAYADYIIDDIERYETPDQTYYLFELEKGAKEIKIKIDLSGKLI
ncbi:MAG: PepSY-like domain-containing protein, partial [Odoribacter splanchnicus]